MLFQAAWASMKNSFMWKRGDGGNRRKRGYMGRKEIRGEGREGWREARSMGGWGGGEIMILWAGVGGEEGDGWNYEECVCV